MKYGLCAVLFLANNEIASLVALCCMALIFCADLLKARSKK